MIWIDQNPGAAPAQTVEAAAFREAMCRMGAAVHIVTTAGPGGKSGFTATALCSVSDAPPTLLVCLNSSSQITPVLRKNKVFCVNTLGAGDTAIADIFAGRTGVFMEERFATGAWTNLKTGSPVFASAVVAFDCRIAEVKSVGSHNVIFGVVEAMQLGPSGPVLLYHDRAYKQV
jgi:flavin reductase (DIM6/NTAB) family NADH-FMN oxidoreductase RutF